MSQSTRRIGYAALALVGLFFALLFFVSGEGTVSDECRAAQERANRFNKIPNPVRVEEARQICESSDSE